jgi:hypothetical protein
MNEQDEVFAVFAGRFGASSARQQVSQEAVEAWRGKLPEYLLAFWRREGWGAYRDGLFWIVNPQEYEHLVQFWMKDTPLEKVDDFHVIARSAFGSLFLCGEKTGRSVTVISEINSISALKKSLEIKSEEELNASIASFLVTQKPETLDIEDEDGEPLFQRALEKLGTLQSDEMYGFEPAIVAGGEVVLDNLRKVKLDQHLTILRQLAVPSMPFSDLDIEKLTSKK